MFYDLQAVLSDISTDRLLSLKCYIIVIELVAKSIQILTHARHVGIGDILLPQELSISAKRSFDEMDHTRQKTRY